MQIIVQHIRLFNHAISTFIAITLMLLLTACASNVPVEIKEPMTVEPSVEEVRTNPDTYLSKTVRWGGIILETENRKDATWLTVLALPLESSGRPDTSDHSLGRFIAVVPEFLEPVVYKSEREMTFRGNVKGSETRKVGDFEYDYPIIEVDYYHLWPEIFPINEEMYPYWFYDPWYYPYYPYYPYRRYH